MIRKTKKIKKPIEVNPHAHEPGYETSRSNKITGGWSVLYKSTHKKEIDNESDGKWAIMCDAHSSLIYEKMQRKAESLLLHPEQWCNSCKILKETEEAKKQLNKLKEKPAKSEEDKKKLLAKLAKGNAEKCRIFEELYNVKPDIFWD